MDRTRVKELRLYGFVPYNISGRQSGIQFGHAAMEHALHYGNDSEFIDYLKNFKTFIMLDGGTTNNNPDRYGTMNLTLNKIKELGVVKVSEFYEPDLNDALTGFVFIADEKLFDHVAFPMLEQYQDKRYDEEVLPRIETNSVNCITDGLNIGATLFNSNYKNELYEQYRKDYMEIIGGEARYELKKILKSARLATN